MLTEKRLDPYWELWSATLENSVLKYVGLNGEESKQYKGHGHVHITAQQMKGSPDLDPLSDTTFERNLPERLLRLQKQALRCQSWADRLFMRTRGQLATAQITDFDEKNARDRVKVKQHLDGTHEQEEKLREVIWKHKQGADVSDLHLGITLKLAAKQYNQRFTTGLTEYRKEKCGIARQQLGQDRHLKKAYKTLRPTGSPPLLYAVTHTVDADGKKVRKYVTSPKLVDIAVRERWAPIYQGNTADSNKLTTDSIDKYKDFLFQAAANFQVGDITGEEFYDECVGTKHSQGGPDGWMPADLSIISLDAACYIADMLNSIERGASWPEALQQGRAAFLAKDPTNLDDPLCLPCFVGPPNDLSQVGID